MLSTLKDSISVWFECKCASKSRPTRSLFTPKPGWIYLSLQEATSTAPILNRIVILVALKFHADHHGNYYAAPSANRILQVHSETGCRQHTIVSVVTIVRNSRDEQLFLFDDRCYGRKLQRYQCDTQLQEHRTFQKTSSTVAATAPHRKKGPLLVTKPS